MARIDMTGERYGKLTVVKFRYHSQRRGESMWLCHCDCGGERVVRRGHLTRGDVHSCGCVKRPSGFRGLWGEFGHNPPQRQGNLGKGRRNAPT